MKGMTPRLCDHTRLERHEAEWGRAFMPLWFWTLPAPVHTLTNEKLEAP